MAERASSRRWDKATFDLGNNTILTAVMTNAWLDKIQLYYLAERAGNGMVRSVSPVHTSFDGDIVFTLSTQEIEINIDNLVELTIEAVRQSIVNAVMMARPLAGIPSIKQ
jgi:L-aminopeptidase/D-esterase-like protein